MMDFLLHREPTLEEQILAYFAWHRDVTQEKRDIRKQFLHEISVQSYIVTRSSLRDRGTFI